VIIQNVASAYQSQPKGSLSLGFRLFGGTYDHVRFDQIAQPGLHQHTGE
jgi:hypothetical protein